LTSAVPICRCDGSDADERDFEHARHFGTRHPDLSTGLWLLHRAVIAVITWRGRISWRLSALNASRGSFG